jgi:Uma2 family endonuclease
MPQTSLAPPVVVYPDTDDLPMPEGGFQFNAVSYAVLALRVHFAHRADVFVAGNMFIYDQEGNPNSSLAPDVFVVFGIPNHTRSTFLLWEERTPDFVMEIASASTVERDRVEKRRRYATLGVKEYWQYDPVGTLLEPPLHGSVLDGGEYAALPSRALADGAVEAYSPVLGLHVRMAGEMLRFHDPASGRDLLTHQDEARARQDAENRLRDEARARQDAEARMADLEARLRALQRSSSPEPPSDDQSR